MNKIFITLLITLLPIFSHAISLDEAKMKGLVGEKPDGYVAIVSNFNEQLKVLVNDINKKRKEQYEKIASKNNQPLHVVERLAGAKLMRRVPVGEFYFLNNEWVKK